MTDPFVAVSAPTDEQARAHYLRLGHYNPAVETAAWLKAITPPETNPDSALEGFLIRTDGQIFMTSAKSAWRFVGGHDTTTVHDGMNHGIYARGTVGIVAGAVSLVADTGASGGTGEASDGEVFIKADSSTTIESKTLAAITGTDSIDRTNSSGIEIYMGLHRKLTYGTATELVMFALMSLNLSKQSAEAHRWRFRVLDTKWAIGVFKFILGAKIEYKGFEVKNEFSSNVFYGLVTMGVFTALHVDQLQSEATGNSVDVKALAAEKKTISNNASLVRTKTLIDVESI